MQQIRECANSNNLNNAKFIDVKYEIYDPQTPSKEIIYVGFVDLFLFGLTPKTIPTFMGAFSPNTKCTISSESKLKFGESLTDEKLNELRKTLNSKIQEFTLWTNFNMTKDLVINFIVNLENEVNKAPTSFESEIGKHESRPLRLD